jgi:hypothetical protein
MPDGAMQREVRGKTMAKKTTLRIVSTGKKKSGDTINARSSGDVDGSRKEYLPAEDFEKASV